MINMTRAEFEEKSFEEVMEQLNEECDEVTTLDVLKGFIKEKIDEDNFNIASHLCNVIWNDPNPSMSEWYLYDYNMGTFDSPVCVSYKEDVEHLIDD